VDTELARTFLAVVSGGSFVEAAQRLYVTQSTVSVRMQRLEAELGATLFDRAPSGLRLTPAGRRFQKHATTLARTVELAKQELGSTGFQATLRIGSRLGLWEDLLLRWLPRYRQQAPDVAVRATIGFEDDLLDALLEGQLDLGLMYAPQARAALTSQRLVDDRLVLVSSRPSTTLASCRDGNEGYVHVDWGPEFLAQHALAFPAFGGAAITVNVGWLGLEHLLAGGGCGYFPLRLVRSHEAAGRLHRVDGAPEFMLPAWLCFPSEGAASHVLLARTTIREMAEQEA
jgi:DNA-binding transcriptional LysR family regulator